MWLDERDRYHSCSMNALITGATGFIGANLIEALNTKGWSARALRRQTSSLRALDGLTYESAIGDINDPASLAPAMRDVDVVFHVAASADYWRSSVEKMMRVNVEGTRNVLQAALDASVRRVVFTSSCAALGKPRFGQALDEAAQFNMQPKDFPYGHSKVLAEHACHEFIQRGLDVVIVNPAVVMGPRDVNLISSSMIVEAAKRGGIPILPPGGVSVVDVADVCTAHIVAAERGRTGERYILTSENLTYAQLFCTIATTVGGRAPWLRVPAGALRLGADAIDFLRETLKVQLPINGEQTRFSAETFWFDGSKARREFGLNPKPFVETAHRTFEWYKENGYL
jgi:dihydroflavonol-4-reductase